MSLANRFEVRPKLSKLAQSPAEVFDVKVVGVFLFKDLAGCSELRNAISRGFGVELIVNDEDIAFNRLKPKPQPASDDSYSEVCPPSRISRLLRRQ